VACRTGSSPARFAHAASAVRLTDLHVHGADAVDGGAERRALFQGPDTFGRAGQDDIAGEEREGARGAFNELLNAHDHVLRVAVLTEFAIDGEVDAEIAGIGNLIGRYQPRPEDRIAVAGLAKTAILRAARRDIDADAIAGDATHGRGAADILDLFADDDGEFDFKVGAAAGKAEFDAFARADNAGRGFQKQSKFVDWC